MRVVVVGREATDYGREMGEWIESFFKATGVRPELLDPDLKDGEIFARAHDIVQYPSTVVVMDNGMEVYRHAGKPMPGVSEVSYYAKVL